AEKRPRMRRPAPVADLLEGILAGKPLAKRLHEGKLWPLWNRVVGPQIAGRAQPATFRDGVLTIIVGSAPWRQQLTFLKGEIIAKLNEAMGEPLVTDLFLKAGSLPPAASPAPTRPPRRPLTATEQEQIASQTADIPDPELRAALAELLSRHLAERPAPLDDQPSSP
ncbi:MAG TPA: DUF721 domain-containing protein, partial [Geobacteraceae bacterium]